MINKKGKLNKMLKKFCPKCNETLININNNYCEKCEAKVKKNSKEDRRAYFKKYNDSRDDIYDFYNSREWKCCRANVKANDNGVCIVCLAKNVINYMTTVHHIVELKDDYSLRLKLSNLISVCDSCHRKIHSIYDTSEEMKIEMIKQLNEIRKMKLF